MNWLADKIEQWPTAKLVPYARNARTPVHAVSGAAFPVEEREPE